MGESMSQYDTQTHLNEFVKWLNENNIYSTSASLRHSLSDFRYYLADIKDENNDQMFSEESCRFSWESWVSVATIFKEHCRIKQGRSSGISAQGKGMAGHYLQFVLETFLDPQFKPVSSLSAMPYLDKLFSKKNTEKIDLTSLLSRLILPKSDPPLTLAFRNELISPGGRTTVSEEYRKRRLSKDGLHFYYAKTIFLARWAISEERPKMIAEVKDYLGKQGDIWERVYGFASELHGAWKNEAEYRQSGTQWILLQLMSVKEPICSADDVFSTERANGTLLEKVSKLLLQLLAEQFQNDGQRFSEPSIKESDFTRLDPDSRNLLLALSPFQQLDIVDCASFLKVSSPDPEKPEQLPVYLNSLIKEGFLWIEQKKKQQYLKITPLPFQLTSHPESRMLPELWDNIHRPSFFLLKQLLAETYRRQEKLLSKSGDSDLADCVEFQIHTELRFILDSVPESTTRDDLRRQNAEQLQKIAAAYLSTQRIENWEKLIDVVGRIYRQDNDVRLSGEGKRNVISLLVKVLAHCYGAQMLSRDPAIIASGFDSFSQLWKRHKEVLSGWDSPSLCTILNRETGCFKLPDFLLLATRLLKAVDAEYKAADDAAKQARQAQWHRYLVSVESTTNDVLRENNDKDRNLAIRGSCLRIRALVLQKKIGGVSDDLTIIRNYSLPCLKELVSCQKKLFAGTKVVDEDKTLIEDTIKIYQDEKFHEICLPDLKPLAFTLETTDGAKADENAENVMKLITQYEEDLKNSIIEGPMSGISGEPSPSASIWPASRKSTSSCRAFYQNWYLSGLDSVVVSKGSDAKDNAKRYIMRHLLEAQNIVLSSNQILDSACIRELAHDSSFLWALKTGRITVSLHGQFDRLTDFAANFMERGYEVAGANAFKWSSLPELDHKDADRRAIAECLWDPLNAEKRAALSSDIRDQATQFIDAVRILDEAIPHFHRNLRFQRGDMPNMMGLMNVRFQQIGAEKSFPDLHKLHRAISDLLEGHASRTDYLDILKLLENPRVSSAGTGIVPEKYKPLLESSDSLSWIANHAVLDAAAFEVNDVYNTMLANRFAEMKEFIYTPAERELVPYDETKRLSEGGCTSYGLKSDEITTGSSLDFADVSRLCIEIHRILLLNPLATPEEIIKDLRLGSSDPLSYTELEYSDGVVLRLARSATKVDNKVLNHELADPQSTGTAYTETK